jgi:hypothetical protein
MRIIRARRTKMPEQIAVAAGHGLALMVQRPHEAARFRPEMAADAGWQRRQLALPARRRPALPLVAGRLGPQPLVPAGVVPLKCLPISGASRPLKTKS